MVSIQDKRDYNNVFKSQLETLLRQKVFTLLIRLANPKEDLQEVLPFIVSKAIVLAIDEKL